MLSNKKPLVDKFLEPLAVLLKHVSPNALTLLGSIPSILFFVFIINQWYVLALIAFIGLGFDAIDGMVARKFNKATKFGGVLDSTFDRISDFLIIVAFPFGGLVRWEIAAPLLCASYLVSYVRSRSEKENLAVSFAIGIMERTERLIIIAVGLVLYILFPKISINSFNIVELVFILVFVLSLYTICQRIKFAYKNL